jgi:hypothetical protein
VIRFKTIVLLDSDGPVGFQIKHRQKQDFSLIIVTKLSAPLVLFQG